MNILPILQEINDLKEQSANWETLRSSRHRLASWSAKVSKAVPEALGATHHLALEVKKVNDAYFEFYGGNCGFNDEYYDTGVAQLRSLLDQTAKELEAHLGVIAVNELSFDPELWEHVRNAVEHEDWCNVPALVVVFVENKIRELSGVDKSIVGKGMFAKAFSDSGVLMLGAQKSEQEGWRGLGMGLAQAVGNVDRHHVQQREDARIYALGVLGLGSLMLTQVKFKYPENLISIGLAGLEALTREASRDHGHGLD